MRISVDITPLLLRSAGVKNYVYHWLLHLRRAAGGHTITTFPLAASFGQLDHEHSLWGRAGTAAGLAWLHFLNYSRVPALDWVGPHADVFHASHQLRCPPRKSRLTATVYDMTCWLTPELHAAANVHAGRWFGERVMRRADGLIAISENSRRDAIRLLGLAPEKIELVYPGVPQAFFDPPPERVAAARARYGLDGPYLLFVGTIEPRKNVATLLDAYAASEAARERCTLLIAGATGWGDPALLARLASGPPGVRYTGYVPEADLPGLTAGATAFLYPSLYEGFGFPVAQAMAAGVPVITSNLSSLPEVAGAGALLVDPRSAAELRAAIDRLLGSPSLRQQLAAAGRCRAAAYTWTECAERSLRFFERVAG